MQTTIDVKGCYDYVFLRKKVNEISSIIAEILPKNKAQRKEYLLSYDFILKCTKTYELFSFDDITVLTFLLATYRESDSLTSLELFQKDKAFTAFYIVALHYYRKRDAEVMYDVLHEYVGKGAKKFSFEKYPMIWDLVSRYAIITKNYSVLLASAAAGRKAMPNNAATGVSYVEGVCLWANDIFYKTERSDPKPFPISINIKGDKEFQKDTLLIALSYCVKAILNNSYYAKYYFQFAELLFYIRVFFTEKNRIASNDEEYNERHFNKTVSLLKNVKACNATCEWEGVVGESAVDIRMCILRFVNVAIDFASTEEEKVRYKRFFEMAENYFNKRSVLVNVKKNKIINSKNYDDCKNIVKCRERGEYVLISYSRADYKSVFCDILEYQEAGIGVVFDDKLDETSTATEAKWHETYRKLMQKAKALICYVSENYIQRDAVMRELEMASEIGITVIPVDLTGTKQISAIISSVIRSGNVLPSRNINLLTTVFDDDQLMYCKGRNVDAVTHIAKIKKVLAAKCIDVFSIITAETCSESNVCNGVPYRPQEDFFVCDEKNGIYVVADGITRQEGYLEGSSAAAKFTETFCEKFHGTIVENMEENVADLYIMLSRSFGEAINLTKKTLEQEEEYRKMEQEAKMLAKEKGVYYEPPGCVFAVGVVNDGILYYGHVGDCAAMLCRKGQVVALTEPQTEYAFKIAKVEKNRRLLYNEYVNNPNNVHGYGVVNGDIGANAFFKVSSIELIDGDCVFLASDGISDFLRINYAEIQDCKTLNDVMRKQKNAKKSDNFLDDRTIIRINVGNVERV